MFFQQALVAARFMETGHSIDEIIIKTHDFLVGFHERHSGDLLLNRVKRSNASVVDESACYYHYQIAAHAERRLPLTYLGDRSSPYSSRLVTLQRYKERNARHLRIISI